MLQLKLKLSKNILKANAPKELLKTLICIPKDNIESIKDLLVGILPQISKLIDKEKIILENLYLSTKDGYMMPPNIPLNVLFKKG
jgi:hypothetical protein